MDIGNYDWKNLINTKPVVNKILNSYQIFYPVYANNINLVRPRWSYWRANSWDKLWAHDRSHPNFPHHNYTRIFMKRALDDREFDIRYSSYDSKFRTSKYYTDFNNMKCLSKLSWADDASSSRMCRPCKYSTGNSNNCEAPSLANLILPSLPTNNTPLDIVSSSIVN